MGIVLAGGRSSRMGTAKSALEWHGSTLLRRVVGVVGRVAGPVIVVRAPGQALPGLPADVRVVDDAREGHGPLQGMLAGLEVAEEQGAEVAYISSTDVPLLHPRFVTRVLAAVRPNAEGPSGPPQRADRRSVPEAPAAGRGAEAGAGYEGAQPVDASPIDVPMPHVAVPFVGGHRHPLAAAYRTSLAPLVAELVAADRMKPAMLFDQVRTVWLDEQALLTDPRLAKVDPNLESVRNLNEPADYETARALPPPEVHVERFGTLRLGVPAEVTVRAATLGQAVGAVGLELDRWILAALNGDQVSRDPELPLVTGDVVQLMTGDAGG